MNATAAGLTLLTAAFWGGTPVAIQYSVDVFPPIAVAGIRFAMAFAFMLAWCWFERSDLLPRKGQWGPPLIAGVMLFFQISLFNMGIEKSNSSHGTLLINTFVFWVAAIEHFITRAHLLTGRRILGLLTAALGVVIVFASVVAGEALSDASVRDVPTLLGEVYLAASGLVLAFKIVYTKYAVTRVEPGKLILWHDLFGVVFFAIASLAVEEVHWNRIDTPAMLALLYQGVVVAGFCFAVQARLLRRHPSSQIAVYSFATPLFGVAAGIVFRGDALTVWLLAAAACVAVGVYVVNTSD